MEKSIVHDHFQDRVCTTLRQQFAVITVVVQQGELLTCNAHDAVLHIDAFARESPMHAWNDDPRQLRQIGCDAFSVAALVGQVEFAFQRPGQFAHQLLGAVRLEPVQLRLGHHGQFFKPTQICGNDLGDAGPANFHNDIGAVL